MKRKRRRRDYSRKEKLKASKYNRKLKIHNRMIESAWKTIKDRLDVLNMRVKSARFTIRYRLIEYNFMHRHSALGKGGDHRGDMTPVMAAGYAVRYVQFHDLLNHS